MCHLFLGSFCIWQTIPKTCIFCFDLYVSFLNKTTIGVEHGVVLLNETISTSFIKTLIGHYSFDCDNT